ncbi:MAG TPA: tRNA pseudouridine(55) synthase TruB [Candidatus Saccharimonadia bacterium]
MDGLLLVNKPVGITSFDVIRRLRRSTDVRKIGHAGTLDPAASGLMLMLFGAGCKQAMSLTKLDKRYVAEIRLGANSSTGDVEGEILPVSDRVPTLAQVEAALVQLTGEITQVPSVYSAIKINGREAYKRVRAGEQVEIPARQVMVYENRLVKYDYPRLEINAKVSSGTYIRTLAEDLGKMLGTGAYLTGLVRIEVGDYHLEDAVELEAADTAMVTARMMNI